MPIPSHIPRPTPLGIRLAESDYFIAEQLALVLSGLGELLRAHAAFDVWCAERGR